ncbi:hypothetical protein [Vibrio breoganii]|uniref:hypothetical protein n=1 Tax=Vibrio breoganii TaxID=553239 RepID=UPI000C850070|nr:hypothetical protein [Vibrio breoganii]PML85243.1 hypothetical protein BCT68_07885 [Vibrio breoganii]
MIKKLIKVTSGALVGQLILFLAIPIVSRLYATSDFGEFALYISIVNILVTIVSFKSDVIFLKVKSDRFVYGFLLLLFLFFVFLSFFSAVFFASIFVFVLGVVVNCIFILGYIRLISIDKFFHVNVNRIIYPLLVVVFQILLSNQNYFENGLIIAQISSGVIISLSLMYNLQVKFSVVNTVRSIKYTLLVIRRYINIGVSGTISSFVSSLSINSTPIIISYIYGAHLLGVYSMMMRLLQTPATVLLKPLSDIYLTDFSINRNINRLFRFSFLVLALSLMVCIVLNLFIDALVHFALGAQWLEVADYTKYMVVLVCFQLAFSPYTQILNFIEKGASLVSYELMRMGLITVGTVICYLNEFSITTFFIVINLSYITYYMAVVFKVYSEGRKGFAQV